MDCGRAIDAIFLYLYGSPKQSFRNTVRFCNRTTFNGYICYALYINITGEDGNGWGWVFFMIVLPIIQLIILLLFWGIQKIAETNEPK